MFISKLTFATSFPLGLTALLVLVFCSFNFLSEKDKSAESQYFESALEHYRSGNTAAAISDFNKVLRTNPDCCASYRGRGDVYYELGEYQKAVADYSKAISINPLDAFAYNSRGWAQQRLGKPHMAQRDWKVSSLILKSGEADLDLIY